VESLLQNHANMKTNLSLILALLLFGGPAAQAQFNYTTNNGISFERFRPTSA
jgi:hypothetical protein